MYLIEPILNAVLTKHLCCIACFYNFELRWSVPFYNWLLGNVVSMLFLLLTKVCNVFCYGYSRKLVIRPGRGQAGTS